MALEDGYGSCQEWFHGGSLDDQLWLKAIMTDCH